MKKKLFNSVLSISTILLLCQCSNAEFEDSALKEQKANFPDAPKQFGLAVATELNGIVRNLHRKGVDYSDANTTVEFKERFYSDLLQSSPSAIKTRSTMSDIQINPEEFVRRVNNLTKIQLDFINRIIKESSASTSYSDFYNRLININNAIYSSVPEIQQERLFNITSVLYYGMKEMQNLEVQGLMISTPQNSLQQVLVKTRSETDGSFGDRCRKFLATTWAIAIGEPTPTGEIVASVVTVIVAGVWLYEVVVCSKSGSGSDSDYDYCQMQYAGCSSPIMNGCSICLQFCLTQGYWPPYSTHKCS